VDLITWLVTGAIATVTAGVIFLAPRAQRNNLRRQLQGGGGSLSGIGAGFDVVWRPSAEEARAQWEAQVEMPAPAPTPGDKDQLHAGRIVIDLTD
jgi:hypothetical protein